MSCTKPAIGVSGLAEEGEKELASLDLTGRTVLLLGAEGQGLRQLTRKKCHELGAITDRWPDWQSECIERCCGGFV